MEAIRSIGLGFVVDALARAWAWLVGVVKADFDHAANQTDDEWTGGWF